MAPLKFLNGLKASPLANFWRLERHEIPASPGVYLLVARSGVRFMYPAGESPVYYVGQTRNLRKRLVGHLNWHSKARDNNRLPYFLLEPRHEYGGRYGGRYCFIRTRRGLTPKELEDEVLACFARRYRAFPVANGAGAWNRIEK